MVPGTRLGLHICDAAWCCLVPLPRLMLLTITFSQHLGSCRLPFCAWPYAPGVSMEPSVPTLRTLSVPLFTHCSACCMWAPLGSW